MRGRFNRINSLISKGIMVSNREKSARDSVRIYIDIHDVHNSFSGRYQINDYGSGECYVEVYKPLDGKDNSPIEHVICLGGFTLSGLNECSAAEFMEKIRDGIEKIVSP